MLQFRFVKFIANSLYTEGGNIAEVCPKPKLQQRLYNPYVEYNLISLILNIIVL